MISLGSHYQQPRPVTWVVIIVPLKRHFHRHILPLPNSIKCWQKTFHWCIWVHFACSSYQGPYTMMIGMARTMPVEKYIYGGSHICLELFLVYIYQYIKIGFSSKEGFNSKIFYRISHFPILVTWSFHIVVLERMTSQLSCLCHVSKLPCASNFNFSECTLCRKQ